MTKSTSLIGSTGPVDWRGRVEQKELCSGGAGATRERQPAFLLGGQEQHEGLGRTFSIQSIPRHCRRRHMIRRTTSLRVLLSYHQGPLITKPILLPTFLRSQIFRHLYRCISAEPLTSFVCYIDAAVFPPPCLPCSRVTRLGHHVLTTL